jgi:hypothetical protein
MWEVSKHCYLAVEGCGCVTGIVCDTDTGLISKESLASDIADFIKSGRRVERVTTEEGKKRFMSKCPIHECEKEIIE